jgi:hypothetical protein
MVKKIYDEQKINEDIGNEKYFNSRWTVWVHDFDCNDWKEYNYTNVYEINSIGTFWRFFNNFHLFDKQKNQFFIMRNKIKPMYEDNENKNGGRCSIKFECLSKPGKFDNGVNIMIAISMLVMNETFVSNNQDITGISYSIGNRSVLIKLWYKDAKKNNALVNNEKENEYFKTNLPTSLIPLKISTILKNSERWSNRKINSIKDIVSIQCSDIKPQWDIDTGINFNKTNY